MKRLLFVSIGLFATICAIIGVILPGMPTTIFLLIALWAFSKSSQRLHNLLSTLPLFKQAMKHVTLYNEKRAITKKAKIIAQLCAWTSAIIIAFTPTFLIIKVIVLALAIGCTLAMMKLKTI